MVELVTDGFCYLKCLFNNLGAYSVAGENYSVEDVELLKNVSLEILNLLVDSVVDSVLELGEVLAETVDLKIDSLVLCSEVVNVVVDCSDDLTETVDLYIEVLVSSLKLVNLSLVSFASTTSL